MLFGSVRSVPGPDGEMTSSLNLLELLQMFSFKGAPPLTTGKPKVLVGLEPRTEPELSSRYTRSLYKGTTATFHVACLATCILVFRMAIVQ